MTLATRLRGLARFDALVLTASLWFIGKFLRYAFPPLFGTLGESYGVSRTVLGTAFTGFMLVYAAMQFPSGALADRLGSVRVIAAGAALAATGALVLVVDAPFAVLAGAMVLMGAGTGAYKTVAVRLLSGVYPDRTGRALGVFDTVGAFGGVAAPAAVVAVGGVSLLTGAPWRTVFLAGGIATIVLAALFVRRVPQRLSSRADDDATATDATGDGVAVGDYLTMFREWQFAGFVAVTILFSFAYNGTVAFLPLYLADETALTAATANLLFSALFVVSLVQLVTGEASDRVGTAPMLVVTLAVATAGLVAVLVFSATGGPLALGGAVVALGLGAHGYRPVRGAYLMAVVPEDVAGGSLGVVRTLLMGAGAVAPAIVGWLSDVANFQVAFGLLAAALIGATGLTAALWLFDR
ncbi:MULTISPECIES: MFS transporter [Halomicrobium]|uniref:Major facilitator superfamily MFS_1 n=2 Tax=Halomicrobium mukohataei TaxID=57705 RepID=C7NX91_HALMD|nr:MULTISPECIES: MFS transporter [Halomicrobium]ACV46456.1 major facilitator superfamily MFS_1 [Halomicrobium mukohataei DSM 12286]QCD65006.1 MFS transporter [Halomicrobium mukohataei]QFR19812.1 MFS transporter [Halomicrobium sp. ZPS1]